LGVTGYRNPTPPKPGMIRKSAFAYDRSPEYQEDRPGFDPEAAPQNRLSRSNSPSSKK
jgi:hypothetical protein